MATADHYDLIKKTLLESPHSVYLADGTENLEWFMGDCSGTNYLVTCDVFCDYYDTAGAARDRDLPPPARLAVIGRLPVRDFHLQCDGNRSSTTGRSAVGRGTACLDDIEPDNKESPFKIAYKNLSALARIPLPAAMHFSHAFGALTSFRNLPVIRLEHHFFRRRGDDLSFFVNLNIPDDFDEPAFCIESWPASNAVCKGYIDNILETHDASPLRAFNSARLLIEPKDYQRRLEEADVWVEFFFVHKIDKRGYHNFQALIYRIRVIKEPLRRAHAPLRALALEDDGDVLPI